MLSPGLRQVLESLPSRIPLAVEVLDRALNVVAPDPGGRSQPLVDTTGELRQQLLASITSGRPQTAVQRGRRITIFPMSVAGDRSCTALLAIGADESETGLVEAWGPLLRAAVESDLSSVATTTRQLQQARHLGAVLRFVQHLADDTQEAFNPARWKTSPNQSHIGAKSISTITPRGKPETCTVERAGRASPIVRA